MVSPAAEDAFAADLYGVLGGQPGGLVFSPVSVAAALRLALLGARGDTAAELAAALHLSGAADAGPGLRLLSDLPASAAAGPGAAAGTSTEGGTGEAGETAGGVFRAPNTVWVQDGLPLEPAFAATLRDLVPEALRSTDFAAAPEQARQHINGVIAEQTAGKIRDLLAPGSVAAATRLVLASAVYLKAGWLHPFPARATADAPFHPEPGQQRTAAMMHLSARLGYLRGDGYQAVTLPYRGGRLAMTVVLPDGPPGDFGPVARRLAAGGVSGLLAGPAERQVRLALPRFHLEATFALVPALRELGIALAFGAGADFRGITGAERVGIDAVVHRAYIDVDEEGTEAAAATAVTMIAMAMTGGAPVEVTVDRPFLFAITDSLTGLPLFLGRVTDPAAR